METFKLFFDSMGHDCKRVSSFIDAISIERVDQYEIMYFEFKGKIMRNRETDV